ncbi:acyl-CoA carboxylase subunit beta [Phocaeicola vulgatus]|nr:acyl-CoA carboxylase subunit beta [Phocaeicola vulgatus]
MTREEIYSRFEELDKRASLGGGVDKIEKQHAQGKMTARERIGMLLDKGTFNELDKLVNHRCTNFGMEKKQIAGDGMVTGYGKIDGRPVFVYAYDFTAHGGSLSETNAAKIVKVQQLALKTGAPVIALNDSGGARIQEGVNSLAGYASIFYQNTIASGVIPQISAILGPCAGGACYSPALTDFIFMVKEKSHMFITGPDVVKTVTNEEVGKEELGGAYTHSSKSGVTHFMCDNEEETLMSIRELLSFLPSNNMEDAPLVPCNDDIHRQVEALQTVIPEDPNMPYDIKDIIEPVLDNQYFFEVMPHFAKNVVVGFGRLGGRSVGIVANQPAWLAGVLDIDASDKAARFIRFCDCFNIPLITFEDVPGFLPGTDKAARFIRFCDCFNIPLITFEDVPGFLPGTIQEHNGIIRHGAKIVYAYAEATVPKVTLITRKAYGGAYIVMSSKPTGADVNLAYPQAEIAVMGAAGAVNILYRKSTPEEKQEIIKDYEDKFSNPYCAAERGLIDEVIMPRDTRYKLIQALEMCHNKNQSNPPKKHGNMPL